MKIYTIASETETFYTLKVGSNAKENDLLFNESSANDIWLHLKGVPSPHGCIINTYNKEIPRNVIKHSAEYILENSSVKYRYTTSKVEYLEYKHISKGSKSGEVILNKSPKIHRVR